MRGWLVDVKERDHDAYMAFEHWKGSEWSCIEAVYYIVRASMNTVSRHTFYPHIFQLISSIQPVHVTVRGVVTLS